MRKKKKSWLLNLMNPIAKNGEDNTRNLEVQNSKWIIIDDTDVDLMLQCQKQFVITLICNN
jgi:hypothetical protein